MKNNKERTIGIVSVLYNSGPVLEDFFYSLDRQVFKAFKLYLVDNNSTDKSVEIAKMLMGRVSFDTVLLEEKYNWGVAKGNNLGINYSLKDGCDYILLSNNDVVFDENTLKILYDEILLNHVTMVVPKIFFWNTDNILWCAGGYFSWLRGTAMHYGYGKRDIPKYNIKKLITYCPTCFMLIDSSVFYRVGMMDEKYFVYCDDTDFCWRSTVIGEEKMMYIPQASVYHKESYSTGGVLTDFGIHYNSRNRVYFALKYYSIFHNIYYFFYLFIIHYILKDIWSMPLRKQKIMFRSFWEGVKLYYD